MTVDISHRIGAHKTTGTGESFLTIDSELLLSTLREAARRATQQQRPILASFIQPIEQYDTILAFTAARLAGLGECFFWEQPSEQNALIGIGAAATIETHGIPRFSDSAYARRTLLNGAVVTYAHPTVPADNSGPVLFGGFTFDPLSPHSQLWADFPDSLLVLSQILLSYNANSVALTVNRMIQASDDIEQCAKEMRASIGQLQAAMKRTPTIWLEETYRERSIDDVLPASEWMEMVANMVEKISHGGFEKVVLAREIQVTLDVSPGVIDISTMLQRLRESYPTASIFAMQRGERFFVGATPERLVQARNGQIHTMALAGSARRGGTEEEDVQIGTELLQNGKNNIEHAIVVAMMREALKKHCTHVHSSVAPQLLKLKNVQHLKTPITGELIPGRCMLDIMADLHPTPAVGGFPRHAALEAIRNTEKLDRGWYAGPLGWIGASGHGEFAVALRSGLIYGREARLFAGCGIVADSEPQAEFAESCLKFQVMLRALGGKS
jgi:isochorismate synthase